MRNIVENINKFFEEIFAIFSLGLISKSSTLHFIILIVNVALPLVILGEYLSDGNLFISADPLSKFTDIVELFGPCFVHCGCILIFFSNRRVFREINELQANMDEWFMRNDVNLFKKAEKRKTISFVVKFLIIQGVGFGIEAFQLISLAKTEPYWQSSIKTRTLSCSSLRLMLTQVIFYCDYTSSRMELLNSMRILILSKNGQDEGEMLKSLKSIKIMDLKIIEMIQLLRQYYKWALLMTITLDVVVITIDIYWIYGGFSYGNNPNFIQSVLCPWTKSITIVILFYSCSNIQKHRENALSEMFEWETDYDSIAHSKRRLFLQHFHTSKFTIDANGFFHLNYSALIGIVEAITIYMVYFFQFMSDSNIFILVLERENKPGDELKFNEIKP